MEQLVDYSGPGGWNDPDMLIGSTRQARLTLTPIQARAQFSLWVVMAAPLILGASLRHLSAFDLATYSNTEALRVNQDPLGIPGRLAFSTCPAYPKFQIKLTERGTIFKLNKSGTDECCVVCGQHFAPECSLCPQGNGAAWCNGDCHWLAEHGSCVSNPSHLPLE